MKRKDFYTKGKVILDRNRPLIIPGKKDSLLDVLVLPFYIGILFGTVGFCLRPYSEKAFNYYFIILAVAVIICVYCNYKKHRKEEPPKPLVITKDEITIDWFIIPWEKIDHCAFTNSYLNMIFTEPINDLDNWSIHMPSFDCSQEELQRAIEFYSAKQLFEDKDKVGEIKLIFISILSAAIFTGILYLIIKMI